MNHSEHLLNLAKMAGFDHCAYLETKDIIFDEALRKSCEQNTCGNYGRNWACPPHCGEIRECIKKAKQYRSAIVVQYIGQLEDSYDFEGMMAAAETFEKMFNQLADLFKKEISDTYPLSAGGCHQCSRCAILENKPCVHPKTAYPSLESHGIYVSDLAQKTNMKYINGQNTVTYFGAVLYHKKEDSCI